MGPGGRVQEQLTFTHEPLSYQAPEHIRTVVAICRLMKRFLGEKMTVSFVLVKHISYIILPRAIHDKIGCHVGWRGEASPRCAACRGPTALARGLSAHKSGSLGSHKQLLAKDTHLCNPTLAYFVSSVHFCRL